MHIKKKKTKTRAQRSTYTATKTNAARNIRETCTPPSDDELPGHKHIRVHSTSFFWGNKACDLKRLKTSIASQRRKNGEAFKKPLAGASKKAVATTTGRQEGNTMGDKITNIKPKSHSNEPRPLKHQNKYSENVENPTPQRPRGKARGPT